jgi:hypothetical protein
MAVGGRRSVVEMSGKTEKTETQTLRDKEARGLSVKSGAFYMVDARD